MNQALIQNLLCLKEFLLPELATQIVYLQSQAYFINLTYSGEKIFLTIDDKSYYLVDNRWIRLELSKCIKDIRIFEGNRIILFNGGDVLFNNEKICENTTHIQINRDDFYLISGCEVKSFYLRFHVLRSLYLYKSTNKEPIKYYYQDVFISESNQFHSQDLSLDLLSYSTEPLILIDINYNVYKYNKLLIPSDFKAKYANDVCYIDLDDNLWYKNQKLCSIPNVRPELCGKFGSTVIIVSDIITVVGNVKKEYNIRVKQIRFDNEAFVVLDYQHRIYHFVSGFIYFNKEPELLIF